MTVFKKPSREDKPNTSEETLADKQAQDSRAMTSQEDVEAGDKSKDLNPETKVRKFPSKRSFIVVLCVLAISVGFLVGAYLHKALSKGSSRYMKTSSEIHNLCLVPYEFTNEEIESESFMSHVGNISNSESLNGTHGEIPKEEKGKARIFFPVFDEQKKGRFIHDFKVNQTGIVDADSKCCFVLPLDREKFWPPRTVEDFMNKMLRGCYDVNMKNIQNTMQVSLPPLTNFTDIGKYITKACDNFRTYLLEESKFIRIPKEGLENEPLDENCEDYNPNQETTNVFGQLSLDLAEIGKFEELGLKFNEPEAKGDDC